MKLASRIRDVAGSSTLAITAKAKKLRQEGFDVVSFSAGEPDFDTPEFIKESAINAIRLGFTKYTPSTGIPELKQAISLKFQKDNGLSYSPSQIIVSCGAKHSLYNVIQVLVDRGEEVILPSPYWVSYIEMIRLAEGKPVILKTLPPDNFKINIKNLERAINSRSKLLILNSPSNPTGCVYTKDELLQIAQVCVKHKIFVLSDEIYEKLIYDGQEHISIGSLNEEIYKLTITVNGVSKTFSMTGWRIGYLGGPVEIAQAIANLQDHSTSNPTSISQKAALTALEAPSEWTDKLRDEFSKRRNCLLECLGKIPGLSYIKPQGAFYVFCNIGKTGLRSDEFAKRLLDEEKVALIPGSGFGADDFVRLSFCMNNEAIIKGCTRIEKWVKQLLKKS
ncbi:MAG: pyridoxal phosphate-dependent aminotransferase [Candidatus Omnitrophota bacterium]|nr:pyridoxal phosphate-dependent aminotransferase [Candidatus Omnitrophota bacterium]